MRRFQNILYVTRGTEGETDSLKQALSLGRNNATTLQVVAVCPMLPRSSASMKLATKQCLPIGSGHSSPVVRLN